MRRALVVLAMAAPLMSAQNAPVTLGLGPREPWVVPKGSFPDVSFTTAPGSVTFTLGSATTTLSVEAPSTITGTDNGLVILLNPAAPITMNLTGTGFQLVQASFFSGDPGCLTFFGVGQTNRNRDTCNASKMNDISEIKTGAGFSLGAGVELIAQIDLSVANSVGAGTTAGSYEVHFQWAVGGLGPTISYPNLEVVQETTYYPYFNDTNITLIANKPTLVRVYATAQTAVKNVTALLHGSRGTASAELGLPRPPMDGPLPIRSAFTLPRAVDRDDIGSSFNFLLPDDWTAAGDLTLRAELQLPPGVEGNPADTTFTQTVHFTTGAQSLSIAYIPFCYKNNFSCPPPDIANFATALMSYYPINPLNVHYFRLFTPFHPWTTTIDDEEPSFDDGGFKAHLEKIFTLSKGRRFDQLAGWLPRISDSLFTRLMNGSSDPPFPLWYGHGHIFMGFAPGGGGTMAHEIAHNLGLRHPDLIKICGGEDILNFSWPYSTPFSQQPGFDFDTKTLRESTLGDLMAYCQPRGISPWDVRQLLKSPLLAPIPVMSPSGTPEPVRPRAYAAAAGAEQILISGWAQHDGSAGSLDPLYRVQADETAPPSMEGGSHCLHFSGAAGALGDYCFQLSFQDVDSTGQLNRQYFTLLAPLPAGSTRVALMAGTQELAKLSASSAPPALSITLPQQGDSWSGGMQTIAWSASDPDNGPVVFTVLYSSDGGQSWIPMALDIGDPQFTFDPSQIVGGSNVFFRVLATNGMNSTSADVGPIQVNQTPTITAPASLDFATATPGDAPIQALTISNPGSGPLMVNAYSIDNPAFTVVSAPAPMGIAAGETGSLSIQWNPASTGAQSATLILTSNDPANPSVTVRLSGTAMAASGCRFGLSSTAVPAGSLGGPGTVKVSASADSCTWTAASNTPWITISAGASGMGDGQVAFTVAANAAPSEQSGTLTIAGVTYTVTQAAAPAGAPSPTISISTKSLTFGPVTLGQPATTQKFTISNTGKADLHVQSITKTGDPSFSLVPAFAPVTIAAGKSVDITVQFAPTVAGTPSGSLSIASDDPDPTHNPITVSLAGTANPAATGGPPAISVSPVPFDFGNVVVGTSKTATLTVGNTGGAPLTVSIHYPLDTFTASPGSFTLQPGEKRDSTIAYSPLSTLTGPLMDGAITIFTNDPVHPQLSVKMAGGVVPTPTPTLTMTPSGLDFGTVAPGQKKTLTYVLKNVGTFPLTLYSTHDIAPPFIGGFSVSFIQPGESQTLGAAFSPASTDPATGDLWYATNNSANDSVKLYLAGNGGKLPAGVGSGATPTISLSTKSLTFGTVTLGQPAATMKFTIGNTGQADLHVNSITPSGDPSFSLVPKFAPVTVAAGKSVDITVQFAPTVVGIVGGSLSIASDDPDPTHNPLTVSLAGTANPASTGGGSGNIISLKMESGTYNINTRIFTNNPNTPPYPVTTFDTDDSTQNFAIGVSEPGAANPLKNKVPNKALTNLAPGSYYTYYSHVYTWGPNIRLTVGWSNGSADVAYFQSGGFSANAVWQYVDGAKNLSVAGEPPVTCKVLDANTQPPSTCSLANDVLLLTISGGSGTGGGTPPQISATPPNLDFGSVPAGQPMTRTVTLGNTGGGTLTVNSIGIPDNPQFSIVQPPQVPFNVPGAVQTITVQFTPIAASAGTLQKGTLTIGSNDPSRTAPLTVPLTGTGTTSSGGPTGACLSPPANLVSWWSGDGNATDSTGGNNGSVQGGTTFAAGEVGQAFQFDGSTGYVSAGNPANLRLTSAITIEAWINPHAAPTPGNMQAVVAKWAQIAGDTAISDSYGLWFRNDDDAGLSLFGAIHQSGGNEPHVLGGTIPLNAWTHVAMTFDSTTGQFVGYVNGQAVSTLTSPGPIVTSSRNVFIGREDSSLPRPFNGLIDEAAVYGRALSASEIHAIYSAGSAGKCKGTGGGTTRTTLTVDVNAFPISVGVPDGSSDSYFLNRLTPPSYPATLRSVQIAFLNQSNSLAAGSPIRILSAASPGGGTNINGISLTRLPATITAVGQADTYDVAPITINSGDFVVGFDAGYPKGIFPAAVDTTPPSRMRSYFGTDGTTFGLIDTTAGLPGNFGIRAIVDLGGGT